MKEKLLSSATDAQNRRLLEALRQQPLTSIQIHDELDILRPSARIAELRQRGHSIFTHRETVETAKGVHARVARYVLMSRDASHV